MSGFNREEANVGPPTHSALQILNERFAKGEIQKDESEDKTAAILSGGQY